MHALVCVACRCEFNRSEVGIGRTVVRCLTCETIGNEHDIAQGAWLTAMLGEAPQRRRVTPPRSGWRPGSGRPPAGR